MVILIPVSRAAVLQTGLPVVVGFAQALPVTPIPEQNGVASVRTNMVNHRGLHVPTLGSTHDAKRVSIEIQLAGFLPRPPIAAGGCGAAILRVERLMLLAELLSALHQFRTAWVSTGVLGSEGHPLTPF